MGLRGLFPDDAFVRRNVAGLDNMMELKVRGGARPVASCRG